MWLAVDYLPSAPSNNIYPKFLRPYPVLNRIQPTTPRPSHASHGPQPSAHSASYTPPPE